APSWARCRSACRRRTGRRAAPAPASCPSTCRRGSRSGATTRLPADRQWTRRGLAPAAIECSNGLTIRSARGGRFMGSTTALPTSLLTHVALPVRDLDATLAFYEKYTTLEVIHRRTDPETHMRTAWLANPGDKTSADNDIGVQAAKFVIVLMS